MSILYLIKKRAEVRDGVTGYLDRLPSSRKIDLIAYRFLAFAFPLSDLHSGCRLDLGRICVGTLLGLVIRRKPGLWSPG